MTREELAEYAAALDAREARHRILVDVHGLTDTEAVDVGIRADRLNRKG